MDNKGKENTMFATFYRTKDGEMVYNYLHDTIKEARRAEKYLKGFDFVETVFVVDVTGTPALVPEGWGSVDTSTEEG